jgi:hypothetical protein
VAPNAPTIKGRRGGGPANKAAARAETIRAETIRAETIRAETIAATILTMQSVQSGGGRHDPDKL